jgi:hypothetical protein
MNKQISLSALSDKLAQIERIVPWGKWESMIRGSAADSLPREE